MSILQAAAWFADAYWQIVTSGAHLYAMVYVSFWVWITQ